MSADRQNPPEADLGTLLRDGINAARMGRRERAQDLLLQVVQQDEGNLQAWLWLSSVVDELEEREICLENVLTLDPANEAARRGLALLREHREHSGFSAAEEVVHDRGPGFVETAVPPGTTTAPIEVDVPDNTAIFDESYLCPYCAAPTQPADRKCPACRGPLWVRSWRQEERASHHLMALVLQAVCAALTAGGVLGLLIYVARQTGFDDLGQLARMYLGLSGQIPAEVITSALELVPRSAVLALAFLTLLSLTTLMGLYLRWKPAFYLFLLNGAGLGVVGAIVTRVLWEVAIGAGDVITLLSRLAMVIVDVAVVVVAFGLVLEVREDLFFEQDRLLFRLDRGPVAAVDFISHGQRHARAGRWAVAAIHFKRAVDQLPNDIGANLLLAAAYGNLRRYELAEKYRAEAQQINPQDPRVQELNEWMERRRMRDSARRTEG